jgi:hypothetical protein
MGELNCNCWRYISLVVSWEEGIKDWNRTSYLNLISVLTLPQLSFLFSQFLSISTPILFWCITIWYLEATIHAALPIPLLPLQQI